MACIFAESFDPYAALSDMTTGQWIAANGSLNTANSAFGVGRYYTLTSTASTATFSSASNEATVYGSIRLQQPSGTSTQYSALTLTDGGTAQCTIRWNSDGSIGLYSGGPAGTLLQTYAGIFTPGTWHGYQFKVVISNTVGSIEIRMDGSTTNAITKTGVNTRLGTTNAFVNGISLIVATVQGFIDDLFLNSTSGNAPTSWPGDVRAVQQVPVATTSKNFDCVPNNTALTVTINNTNVGPISAVYRSFVPPPCTVASVSFQMNSNYTGNVKVAIFDATGPGGTPGTSLGSASVTNPTTSTNIATFGSPIPLNGNTTYYVGYNQDGAATYRGLSVTGYIASVPYGSFPTNNPAVTSSTTGIPMAVLAITTDNTAGIQELIQDGDTSYVYTSTIEEDKYSMSPIATTYSVVAMQYFACYKRSDVGARTMQLSVAANGSSDTALFTDAAINTSYTYKFKTLENDPTGAAWTPTNVNSAIVGIAVTV
jgi:hypothetical protein